MVNDSNTAKCLNSSWGHSCVVFAQCFMTCEGYMKKKLKICSFNWCLYLIDTWKENHYSIDFSYFLTLWGFIYLECFYPLFMGHRSCIGFMHVNPSGHRKTMVHIKNKVDLYAMLSKWKLPFQGRKLQIHLPQYSGFYIAWKVKCKDVI